MISYQKIENIQQELLLWYDTHRRDLPWRRTSDPYKIWVSEIMLQQTRVDTVIPYYNRFMEQFPTLERLAEASQERVTKAWEGLGYYSRVRNLHAAAKEVMSHYRGVVPQTLGEISKLKGVGPYTAGAILSIAYNIKAPAVDGNVMRVFSRLFSIHEDIAQGSTRKKMEEIAYHIIPVERPGDFNQALMELGAMICLPISSQCLFCPLNGMCEAYAKGTVDQLPVKKKAKPQVIQEVVFGWIVYKKKVLVERRQKGLLGGLSGFPTIERSEGETPVEAFSRWAEEYGLPIQNPTQLGAINHIFSHRHWRGILIKGEARHVHLLPQRWEWMEVKDLFSKTFPVVYQKVIKKAMDEE